MIKRLLQLFILLHLIWLTACNKNRSSSSTNTDFTIETEPYFKYAWHFAHNESFANKFGIYPDANIHIQDAWDITQGEGVTVAVIDAGAFNENHEDLKDNIINIYNADFQNTNLSSTNDEPSHGTTVAGFIASPINGKGLIGAAPKAKLILIKQTSTDDVATIRAFKYAKDNGAKVINNSWGTNNVSQAIADYITELKAEGITIVFASGNEDCDLDQKFYLDNYGNIICSQDQGIEINDESELPSVIGVGASSEFNDVTTYSNYGSNIDLLAPGGDTIKSSGILGLNDTGINGRDNQRALVNSGYSFTNGTSFAAPIATGVIALMISVNPTLTPDQIREILIQTTDKVGKKSNYINGFDKYRAYGKINATKAVLMARDLKN